MNNKAFSTRKRVKSFRHAARGVRIFLETTHNAWIQIIIFLIALVMGIYFMISLTEWLFLILASGLVLIAEAINTAIEIDIDLTSPEFHPYAKDTKDVSAGAVLIAAVTSIIIGVIIFGPHVLSFLGV